LDRGIQSILSAALFAAEKHSHQKRKGAAAEPYINHLIEVAQLVSMAVPEPDPNLVMAALLHDVVEDTDVSKEELMQRFSPDVANLVAELTDDMSLPKAERRRLQIEHAPTMSVRAQIIKLADKISNLRGVLFSPPVHWSRERKRNYFDWGKRVVDALSQPNPILKAEFEKTYQQFDEVSQ
jgi:GTP diphosphokinase / guanosine-3',5'-bis(diphosphate) 3'-diphosphatase